MNSLAYIQTLKNAPTKTSVVCNISIKTCDNLNKFFDAEVEWVDFYEKIILVGVTLAENCVRSYIARVCFDPEGGQGDAVIAVCALREFMKTKGF